MRFLFAALPILLAAACSPGEYAAYNGCKTMSTNADIPVTPSYDSSKVRMTATGLGIEDLREGGGAEALAGSVVAVHYTGWLTDDSKFDSSRDRGTPLVFPLGRQRVIAGWDEGVAGMKVGGRRKLIIPARLGYGDQGAPGVIPPGATLIFDVELCQVR
ncbi:MAG TPA: FKBP-type peptidyl-prolyl cis-trans isomerase [Gemmatimonadales bacterium]|nr:FKBP-type peptidyl-prolyl cis-trans isomerase [Gemmatimonadales bacterium]